MGGTFSFPFQMVTATTGALAQEKGINKTYRNSTFMIKGKLKPVKTRTYMKRENSNLKNLNLYEQERRTFHLEANIEDRQLYRIYQTYLDFTRKDCIGFYTTLQDFQGLYLYLCQP